ncbi:MAG: peptidylprolyl isomerase, partial [Phycisphaerae bacterium]|nr:peptidylprolyl isomerase [Phycisphaerae bacterium]
TAVPDSATSEFFINLNDNPGLDYVSAGNPGYAVFGEVIEGMAVVDAIGQVARHDVPTEYGTFQNVPVTPIIITEVTRE